MEAKPRTAQQLREHILTLEKENVALKEENKALKVQLEFARGVPVEKWIAGITDGELTNYKDLHDVTSKNGTRLEVKYSKVHTLPSKTKRWNWGSILGQNEKKKFDFLVLAGLKDPRYEYPDLTYVVFLIPRSAVNDIMGRGNCVALNTNLDTAKASKSVMLKRYLVRSQDEFERFKQVSTV
jgi:hypothetical protein